MKALWRWLVLVLLAFVLLQLFFVLRIAAMAVWAPESTAFERSQMWQIASHSAPTNVPLPTPGWHWQAQWVDYGRISEHLKRAVITSEDDGFANHDGVDWDALEKAWQKNEKAAQKLQAQQKQAPVDSKRAAKASAPAKPPPVPKAPKIIGGSTISQQLAKNLFLSGERTLLRKGQELALTFLLERLLTKQRILEIYLNSVEWGEGIFGAEAAAQRYFRKSASQLNPLESARLAVMLPRPKYFEKLPNSAYVAARAQVIAGRMGNSELP